MRLRSLQYVCALVASLALFVQLTGPPAPAAQPTERDLSEAEEELGQIHGELGSAQAQLGAASARLVKVRKEISSTEAEVEEIAKRILRRKDELRRIARELYKNGAAGGLEVLMSADDLSELEERAKYLQSSGQIHMERLEKLATDRVLLLEKLDELDSARGEVAEMVSVVQRLEADLQAELNQQQSEVGALEADLEAQRLQEAREAELRAQRLAEELQQIVEPPPPPPSPGGVDWDAIAQCESGGRWDLDSTYDGGLQFHPDTWLGYGGGAYARYAWQATREQQIAIAEKVLAGQGPGAWPNCFQYG
ncbi:MAG: transglycosylase family protein [Actinomycetota bacterium]